MAQADLSSQPSQKNPTVATVLALIVPGAGHFYVGANGRGRGILAAVIVSLALLWWLDLWILLPLLLPFWLYNAWDARAMAQGQRTSTFRLALVGAILIYAIGWQVTQINLDQLSTGLPKVKPFIAGLLSPEFFSRDVTYDQTRASIQVPCSESPPAPVPPGSGPSLVLASGCAMEGDALPIQGVNFPPNTEGELWWINTIGDRSRLRANGEFIDFQADDQGAFTTEIVVPAVTNDEPQMQRIEARWVISVGPLHVSTTGWLVLKNIGVTIALALMATTFGALLAIPLSFLAARNLMQFSPLAIGVYYVVRTILNILRAIEPLIMAIVFVVWVGLGPFAGVLALTLHSIAALGKLYSESIESIEIGPIEAVTAVGATRPQVIWFAVLPQVMPPFIAFTVYRWDINVRMSTIIGFVGGGGIGFLLQQWIRLTDFRAAGTAIIAIAIVVTALDFMSSAVRRRVV